MFRELKIQKPRGKKYTDQYLNVCLVLNNDINSENCTGKISKNKKKNNVVSLRFGNRMEKK